MEDPHASPSSSRSTISSLLNDDASSDAQEVDPFASYGSPFLPDFSTTTTAPTFKEELVLYDEQPPSKRRRQSIDVDDAEAEPVEAASNFSNPDENGHNHQQQPIPFPSLHLHPLGSAATAANPLPSPSLLQPDHDIIEEERRALAEEKRKVESERLQLEDDKRAFEEEKRQFHEEKKRWLEEKEKQASGTGKPTISLFSRRTQTQLEEQSFGCAFVKNNAVVTKPSPHFAQAYVLLEDMMTRKRVELPLAIGIGAKDSSLPKKAVQDLGSILIPQQTRDYGPSYAKTGYLVVNLKDQKGGAPVRIEAVEGSESDVGQAYFIITKGDLGLLRCLASEKEGVISNDHTGSGETTEPASKGKRKK